MKEILIASFALLSVAQRQCSKQAAPVIPSCMQARIDSIKQQPQ